MNEEKYIKVTNPQEGCPRGRVLYVIHIQDNGTAVGLNVKNDNDWTKYYVPNDEYEFVEKP